MTPYKKGITVNKTKVLVTLSLVSAAAVRCYWESSVAVTHECLPNIPKKEFRKVYYRMTMDGFLGKISDNIGHTEEDYNTLALSYHAQMFPNSK